MANRSTVEVALRSVSLVFYRLGRSPEEIQKKWLIIESGVIITVILFYNLAYRWTIVLLSDPELTLAMPVVLSGLKSPALSLVNLWLALALIVNAINLRNGRWTRFSRWAGLAVTLAAIGVLGFLLIGGPAVSLNPQWAAAKTAAGLSLARVQEQTLPLMNNAIRLSLGAAWLAMILVFIQRLSRLWRHETSGRPSDLLPGNRRGLDPAG